VNFTKFLKFSKIQSHLVNSHRSQYDFIHNKKRNRLTEQRARDLVSTHSNLRLMKQIEAVDYVETTVEWE